MPTEKRKRIVIATATVVVFLLNMPNIILTWAPHELDKMQWLDSVGFFEGGQVLVLLLAVANLVMTLLWKISDSDTRRHFITASVINIFLALPWFDIGIFIFGLPT